MKKLPKIFVIDTNVLLHDYKCIYNFEENDIIIPITVLEELDHFKKGNELINYHAREFVRELDKICGDKLFNQGIALGKGLGKLKIETGKPFSPDVQNSFSETIPDHRILATADFIRTSNPERQVVLISKDINLRMKAKSLGIQAQDYETGKVQNLDHIYKSVDTFEDIDQELINTLYSGNEGVPADAFGFKNRPYAHQHFILRSGKSSILARYNPTDQHIHRVMKQTCYSIEPRNAEQAFAFDVLMNPEIPLVALTGKAGTGKTLLALAAALAQKQMYEKIYLARPIVPLSNKDLGFLPGDVNEKISPYMTPLFDNLDTIKHRLKSNSKEYLKIDEMRKNEELAIAPLAYIRGRSLSNAFFIVDEAQNLTPHEVKTIITRAGEGTKMIFTGDIFQIDSPYLDTKSNGLTYLSDRMRGQNVFAHVNLIKGERSQLAELASNLL